MSGVLIPGGGVGDDIPAPAVVPPGGVVTVVAVPVPVAVAPAPPALTVEAFRAIYPRFADTTAYSATRVQAALDMAALQLRPAKWGASLPLGLGLLTAHLLALDGTTGAGGAFSGGARGAGGPISSKSIGGVSVAYNTELGTIAGAGAYNLTPYGVQFWQLARLIGMGGVQL